MNNNDIRQEMYLMDVSKHCGELDGGWKQMN
jgi:hypothetical protein